MFAAKGSLRVSKRSEDHQLHEKPDKNREREECAQQKQHQAQRRKVHDQRNRKRKKRCAIKMKKRRERRKKKLQRRREDTVRSVMREKDVVHHEDHVSFIL